MSTRTVKIRSYKLPYSLTQKEPMRLMYSAELYGPKSKYPDLSMSGFTSVEAAISAAKKSAAYDNANITAITVDGVAHKEG